MRHLDFDSVAIGDFVHVRIHNPHGDRNLDGGELRGIVVERNEEHRLVKLASGWCCHEKDELLEHSSPKQPQEQ